MAQQSANEPLRRGLRRCIPFLLSCISSRYAREENHNTSHPFQGKLIRAKSLRYETECQTRNLPRSRSFAECPPVVVFRTRHSDVGVADRRCSIAGDRGANVGMLGESRVRGKDNVDVPVTDRLPALPNFESVWIVRRVIRVGHAAIARPNSLQAINILLYDGFAFCLNQLTNRFVVTGRNRGRRADARHGQSRRRRRACASRRDDKSQRRNHREQY